MTKLLYIANVRIPTEKAHGIQIMKTCEALASIPSSSPPYQGGEREGVEVQLVLPTRTNPIKQDPFDYYGVERNFEITKLKTADPKWLQRFGGGVYIKVQGSLFGFSLNSYLGGMDLSDSILYTRDVYLLPVLQRFTPPGAVVVWEAHNLPVHKDYYLKYWQKCAVIIAISQGLQEDLVKLGIEEKRITVAPDGVDLQKFKIRSPIQSGTKFEIRKELGLPQDKKIVMYTGNFFEWKGVYVLAEAAQEFDNNFLFIFIGGSPEERGKFEDYINGQLYVDRHIVVQRENIKVMGHKPYSDIPKYLLAADVLVLPNSAKAPISKFYTSPLKMFEYMAAGVPIVASDLPSTREVLNQENAILVEPDNPEALAEGIGRVLRNPDLAGKISQEALKDAQKYDWKQRAKTLLDTF